MHVRLGHRAFDVGDKPLVMGILNRTTDSFYDKGAYFQLGSLVDRAATLIREGADILEVGARSGAVGTRDVSECEEAELVTEAVHELVARFDVPIAVDTWRSSVALLAFRAGAVVGNDMSGFSEPRYLEIAANAGATVVATHMRLAPQIADPDPVYGDVVVDVCRSLRGLVDLAESYGIERDKIIVDPGLDLGKTWRQSLRLLGRFREFTTLGCAALLAASRKIFLGRALNLPKEKRHDATVAACAFGIAQGARVLRVHDARGARNAADLFAAMVAAERDRC
ncbi:MAG: dihydropteroate synthase [Actinomycetota bacterium]|nr:dihydropteroate synthase [Actinomycetota bacterium]